MNSEENLSETEKQIKKVSRIILKLSEEKTSKIYSAMETGGKELSTQIRKPRKIKKIVKFFSNKFNTYKIIEKNVIDSLNLKIEDFKNNNLDENSDNKKEFNLKQFEKKLEEYKYEIKNKNK